MQKPYTTKDRLQYAEIAMLLVM